MFSFCALLTKVYLFTARGSFSEPSLHHRQVLIFEFAVRFEENVVYPPEAALGCRGFDNFGGLSQSLCHIASA